MMKLHLLLVQYRLKFKNLLQMFEVVNVCSPSYLANLISKHVPSCYLRSKNANLFAVSCTLSNFGDCRFSFCGPSLWNNLATYIKCAESLSQFKTLLKSIFTPKLLTSNYFSKMIFQNVFSTLLTVLHAI